MPCIGVGSVNRDNRQDQRDKSAKLVVAVAGHQFERETSPHGLLVLVVVRLCSSLRELEAVSVAARFYPN